MGTRAMSKARHAFEEQYLAEMRDRLPACEVTRLEFLLPIRTVTEGNTCGAWYAKAKRAASQRNVVRWHWILEEQRRHQRIRVRLPCVVTLTRIAPRELDSDNAVGSQKHVRDQIAEMIGVDDRDPRIEWVVTQTKGKPKEYAVAVTIQGKE